MGVSGSKNRTKGHFGTKCVKDRNYLTFEPGSKAIWERGNKYAFSTIGNSEKHGASVSQLIVFPCLWQNKTEGQEKQTSTIDTSSDLI